MQIKYRNYQYSGIILNYKLPQFKIRKSNRTSNNLKTSPQKSQNDKSLLDSISQTNQNLKTKIISMSLDQKNSNYICKKPILYKCDIDEDFYILNKKPEKNNKSYISQKPKVEEKMLLYDNVFFNQQFRRFSEKIDDSKRGKATKQLKQQLKMEVISNDYEIEPKGWTNRSSQSLL